MPYPSPEPGLAQQLTVTNYEANTPKTRRSPIPSTSREFETPKKGFIPGNGDDVDDDDSVKEEAYSREEEENVGTVASGPYMGRRRRFLDTQYVICKDGELSMIGVSPVFIDTDDNITIKCTAFRGTEAMWEIFTCKNVNTDLIGKDD